MILDDYLERLRAGLRRLPTDERDAVVEEVRHHLQDEAEDLHKTGSGLTHMDALRRAIDNFGPAEEVAAAYDEQTGEVRRPGGEVLRVTQAVGRGAGRAAVGVGRGIGALLKWSLVTVLVLVGVTAVVAVAVLVVFEDEIKEAVPRPLDHYSRDCTTTSPCAGIQRAASFDVGPDVKEFRILFDGSCTAGSARVQATDPSGDVITLTEDVCDNGGVKTFTEQGRWTIDVVYSAYIGDVDIDVLGFERSR